MKTLYDILGVAHDADKAAVRGAYRKLVKRFHPDSNQQSNSRIFEEITAAYHTLSHAEKRKAYDLSLTEKQPIRSMLLFSFREIKNWVLSLKFLKPVFTVKRIAKKTEPLDPSIMGLSVEELLTRVVYSSNVYVQTHAVKAIFAKDEKGSVDDLLRILYSNIHETVKLEIIQGLSENREPRVKKAVQSVYDIEKSLKVKQAIRSLAGN